MENVKLLETQRLKILELREENEQIKDENERLKGLYNNSMSFNIYPLQKENAELKEAILKWWEEHEYDTQGDFGEYNVYDEEPYFVRLAKK